MALNVLRLQYVPTFWHKCLHNGLFVCEWATCERLETHLGLDLDAWQCNPEEKKERMKILLFIEKNMP